MKVKLVKFAETANPLHHNNTKYPNQEKFNTEEEWFEACRKVRENNEAIKVVEKYLVRQAL